MKKALTFLLLAAMLTAPLTGCGSDDGNKPAKTTDKADNSTTDGTDDSIPEYNAADANPASDFEYEVGEDGGITITKYIGTDTDVVIPEKIDGKKVTVIGRDAFASREGYAVVSVVMPNTILLIDFSAFNGCEKLVTIKLSAALEKINNGAFADCFSLSNISLPNTLSYLGTNAFMNCSSLKHINIPKSIKTWNPEVFVAAGIESVDLEEGLTVLGDSAFMLTPLKNVTIPSSIKTIPRNAFASCALLEKVTLKEGLETIEALAFSGASKLPKLVIPSTVISCDVLAFIQCSQLKHVKFEGNAPSRFEIENEFLKETYADSLPVFTIYYHEGATGFTTPEWNGYKTEIW